MTIRIAIADDHPVVRKGLGQVFAEEPDIDLVAQCSDGDEIMDALESERIDVAVVDLRMRVCGGLDVLRWLRTRELPTRVIILAGHITDDEVVEAMRLGAKGVVLKELAPALLVQSIRKVAAGGTWLEKDAVARAMEKLLEREERRERVAVALTPREVEILRMVLAGHGNREIAESLFISEGTVKTHVRSIFEKLGVKSRMQLAALARENAIV